MPTKTFLPGTRVTFHPLYEGGDSTSHVWATTSAIEELEKNQAEFIKALRLVMENGMDALWENSNLELVNNVRLSIGLKQIEVEQ